MPDFKMCDAHECPMGEVCARYLAMPADVQPYGTFNGDGSCKDVMPIQLTRVALYPSKRHVMVLAALMKDITPTTEATNDTDRERQRGTARV